MSFSNAAWVSSFSSSRPGLGSGAETRSISPSCEPFHPALLAGDIERAMPADREKPFRQMPVDLGPGLSQQSHKCVLHDIAGPLAIAQQPGRIANKRSLVLFDGGLYPGVLVMICVLH